jgi:hypothetical protein
MQPPCRVAHGRGVVALQPVALGAKEKRLTVAHVRAPSPGRRAVAAAAVAAVTDRAPVRV